MKLLSWKRLYLLKSGRLTLLKKNFIKPSDLYLSLFTIPKSVVDRLERIHRNIYGGF